MTFLDADPEFIWAGRVGVEVFDLDACVGVLSLDGPLRVRWGAFPLLGGVFLEIRGLLVEPFWETSAGPFLSLRDMSPTFARS